MDEINLRSIIKVAANGIPGLDAAFKTVDLIYARARDVKVYRQQCNDLASRSRAMLLAVQDSQVGMEGTKAIELADEVEYIVSRIRSKVEEWASYSRVKSVFKINDIKDGIDAFYRDFDACVSRFHLQIGMEHVRNNRDMALIQERDRAELLETLQKIALDVEELKAIRGMPTANAVEMMQNIEEELDDPNLEPSQQDNLRRGLTQIRQKAEILPPMTDLTGEVQRTSEYPVALGTFNDIYVGKWGDRQVALRLTRALPNDRNSQKRFEKEVEIWRRLQHPNCTRLYGTARIGDRAYMVSHWMDHGNAIAYVQNNPDADRLRLLYEVSLGLDYLHKSGIIHGDLRGANVLISKRGKACLSDFGFSKVLEESGNGASSLMGSSTSRWSAPELMQPSLIGLSKVSASTSTDVWSFGMLCLELMTGRQPYSDVDNDITVAINLSRWQLPSRPGTMATEHGMTDDLWAMMLKCWHKIPHQRPTMTQVKDEVKRIRDKFAPPRPARPALIIAPVVTVSPAHTTSDLPPDTPSKFTPLLKTVSRTPSVQSTSSKTSTKSKRPTSAGGILSRLSRRSSSQQSAADSELTPSKSPISPLPPVLGEIPTEVDEESLDIFNPNPISSPRSALPHVASRNRGNSLQDKTHSRASSLQIPISSSLPRDYGSRLLPLTPSDGKDPSILSFDSYYSASSGTVESTSSNSSSYFTRSKDGSIETATLDALVEQLISDSSDVRKAVEFRDIFLTTYSAFSTTDEVFGKVVRRFQEAEAVPGPERAILRVNIMTLFKYWVTSPHVRLDTDVLYRIMDFAKSVQTSDRMRELAQEVMEAIDVQIMSSLDSPKSSSSKTRLPDSKVTQPGEPRELAIALLVLEGDRFNSILPADCITHIRDQSAKTSIKAASDTNNKIINWVKQGILRQEDYERRSQVLKFFILTAEECRKQGNFASMSAIVTAVNSSAISRLNLTSDLIHKDVKNTLKKLSKILEPKDNFKAYRTILKEGGNDACIPIFAVHIHDITKILTQGTEIVDVAGTPMLNFAKWTRLCMCMKDVFRHKIPDLEVHRGLQAGTLAYLNKQLSAIPVGKKIDDMLEERSRVLEKKEDVMRQLRLPELSAVGMR